MTATTTEIKVGAVFGYRKVVEVTTRNVSYINLNGRRRQNGRVEESNRPVYTVSRGEFRRLAGL